MSSLLSSSIRLAVCAALAFAPLAAMCGGAAGGHCGYKAAHELDGASSNISMTIGNSTQTGTLKFGAKTLVIQGQLAGSGLIGGTLTVTKSGGFTATSTYADGAVITWTGTCDKSKRTATGTVTLKRKDGTTDSLNFGSGAVASSK